MGEHDALLASLDNSLRALPDPTAALEDLKDKAVHLLAADGKHHPAHTCPRPSLPAALFFVGPCLQGPRGRHELDLCRRWRACSQPNI